MGMEYGKVSMVTLILVSGDILKPKAMECTNGKTEIDMKESGNAA